MKTHGWSNRVEFSELRGKTLIAVDVSESDDAITFMTSDGDIYDQIHEQDCCEDVYVEDVAGDFDDLLDEPLLVAEEIQSVDAPAINDYDESWTWTFYKLATRKGYVTIRWYGSSSGYYSEEVDLFKREKEQSG